MQCFKIPESVCDSISRLCATFWWGGTEEKRSIHWAKWDKICCPKAEGGVGFRNLRAFNKALLAKQFWRICTMPESLVAKVFRAKYCRDGDFLRAHATAGCSYVWRSIVGSKGVVEEGARWKIGDGRNIRVFSDRWVSSLNSGMVKGLEGKADTETRVCQLVQNSEDWDDKLLEELFPPHEVKAIKRVPMGEHGLEDEMRWEHDQRGLFSVKTAYLQQVGFFQHTEGPSREDLKFWHGLIWKISIPPKAKIMIWKACNNYIATEGNLRVHHVPVDGICKLCHDRWASTEHALFFCPRVIEGWKNSRFWRFLRRAKMLEFVDIAMMIRREFESDEYEVWCFMVWRTWNSVCKLTHESGGGGEQVTEERCWANWEAYQGARPTRGGEV